MDKQRRMEEEAMIKALSETTYMMGFPQHILMAVSPEGLLIMTNGLSVEDVKVLLKEALDNITADNALLKLDPKTETPH